MDYPIVINAYRGATSSCLIELDTTYVNDRSIQVEIEGGFEAAALEGNWIYFDGSRPAPTRIRYQDGVEEGIEIVYFDIPSLTLFGYGVDSVGFAAQRIPNIGGSISVSVHDSGNDYLALVTTVSDTNVLAVLQQVTENSAACLGITAESRTIYGPSTEFLLDINATLEAYVSHANSNILILGTTQPLLNTIGPGNSSVTLDGEMFSLTVNEDPATLENNYYWNYDPGREVQPPEVFSVSMISANPAVSVTLSSSEVISRAQPFLIFQSAVRSGNANSSTHIGIVANAADIEDAGFQIGTDPPVDPNDSGNSWTSNDALEFQIISEGAPIYAVTPVYAPIGGAILQLPSTSPSGANPGWYFFAIGQIDSLTIGTDNTIGGNFIPLGLGNPGSPVYATLTSGLVTPAVTIPLLIVDATYPMTFRKDADSTAVVTAGVEANMFAVDADVFTSGLITVQSQPQQMLYAQDSDSFVTEFDYPSLSGTGVFTTSNQKLLVLHNGYIQIPSRSIGDLTRNTTEEQAADYRVGFPWDEEYPEIFSLTVDGVDPTIIPPDFYTFDTQDPPSAINISSSGPYADVNVDIDLPSYEDIGTLPPLTVEPHDIGASLTFPVAFPIIRSVTVNNDQTFEFTPAHSVSVEVTSPSNALNYSFYYTDVRGFISDSQDIERTPAAITLQNSYDGETWTTVVTSSDLDSSLYSFTVNGVTLQQTVPGTFTATVDLPAGTYSTVAVAPQTMAYSFPNPQQNSIVVGDVPAIVVDPAYSFRSSTGFTSTQALITNHEQLAGYTIIDNEDTELVPDIQGFVATDHVITSLQLQGYPETLVEVNQTLMPGPTRAVLTSTSLELETDGDAFEMFINQESATVATTNPADIPLEDVPPNTTAVAYVNSRGVVSEFVTVTRGVTVSVTATYNNGVTTFTVVSDDPDFDTSSVHFEINGVESVDGVITLQLPPGTYTVQVINDDPEWTVTWIPDPLTIYVPGQPSQGGKNTDLVSYLAIIFILGSIATSFRR